MIEESLFTQAVIKLTVWENYQTNFEFESEYIKKMFAIILVNRMGMPVITTFILANFNFGPLNCSNLIPSSLTDA